MTSEVRRYLRGTRQYRGAKRDLIATIRKYGGEMHQDHFDSEYRFRYMPATYMTGDTFILGSIHQGPWARWLDLLQHMVSVSLVRTCTTEEGKVVYYLD